MKNRKKDFYTNRWLALDAAAYLLAIVVGLLIGGATYWGVIAVFGLEGRAAGGQVVAGVLTIFAVTFVIALIGTIGLYDMFVDARYGRERGLLKRAVAYAPFKRA